MIQKQALVLFYVRDSLRVIEIKNTFYVHVNSLSLIFSTYLPTENVPLRDDDDPVSEPSELDATRTFKRKTQL